MNSQNLPAQVTVLKSMLSAESTKKRFNEILGKKGPGFISSIMSAVNGSEELQKCIPETIIGAAVIAAGLDLPIVPGLGFAGILPYKNNKKNGIYEAQFQVFKKGYIQLTQRSGQANTINVSPVLEGQLISCNPFTGDYIFDANKKKSDLIIGYVAYLRLINGFEKYKYMTVNEIEKHAKKYSAAYRKGYGKWADRDEGGFEQMCEKTVIKLLLSGYAPLSIEMQNAIVYDQSVVTEHGYEYADNTPDDPVNKEHERITLMIQDCKTPDELKRIEKDIPMELIDQFAEKQDQLKEASKQTDLFPEKKTKKIA